MQVAVDEAVSVPTSAKLVRSPGPAHPYMTVPPEFGETAPPGCSQATFVFPTIAIYCHPPSPTASMSSCSRSPSSSHCQSPGESRRPSVSNVEEAARTPVKPPVGARLSVPTDGPQRRRSSSGSLSRSQSHPLHRHRGRSRPPTSNVDTLAASRHQQTERPKHFTEYTS